MTRVQPADETKPERLRQVLTIAVVIAFLAAAFGFYRWYALANDEGIERAELRDAALADGAAHIVTLNSLDATDLDAGVQAWLDVSTGALHDDLRSISDDEREAARALESVLESELLGAALVDFDAVARTATVIAMIETSGTTVEGVEQPERNRFEAQLVFTEDGWLVEWIEPLDVDVSPYVGEGE